MKKEGNNKTTIPEPSTTKALFFYCLLPLTVLVLPGLYHEFVLWVADVLTESPSPPQAKKAPKSPPLHSRSPQEMHRQQQQQVEEEDVEEQFRKKVNTENSHQETRTKPNTNANAASGSNSNSGGVNQAHMDQVIASLRSTVQDQPTDPLRWLALADALRQRDLAVHDGGSVQVEAIQSYRRALSMLEKIQQDMRQGGRNTKQHTLDGSPVKDREEEEEEVVEYFLPYREKSLDGLLCAVYSNLGKMYFMANMFENAVEAYEEGLRFKPNDLDALGGRASAYIILGKHLEAGADYTQVLRNDKKRMFVDAFTGLAKVLVANETAVEGGWEEMVQVLEEELIPDLYSQLGSVQFQNKAVVVERLKRAHLAMFQYHDVKTKNVALAWDHLEKGMKHKMSLKEPFDKEMERMRVETTKRIFNQGFWPLGVGSTSQAPIFIIGFVRSGSTLLERILDAHPQIVGTGEDSIFNGRLAQIRDAIVQTAPLGMEALQKETQSLAKEVVTAMKERWRMIDDRTTEQQQQQQQEQEQQSSSSSTSANDKPAKGGRTYPKRYVDKMLTNYMNVGFIHLLFPKALILHVVREPMDTLFSAFKHDFPPGHLDYLSAFDSLAEIYDGYRSVMEHWDEVLPGRVTHIRYEDVVKDNKGLSKALIAATGLPWDPEVLHFHKKKQAVNTLSTNQVRKGIYKDSMKSWQKYESQLQPLKELVGARAICDLKTTLVGYNRHSSEL